MKRNTVKAVDGVAIELVHSGQKKAYGDTFTEYVARSDLPSEHVEKVLRAHAGCDLSRARWMAEQREKASAALHFRSHYTFTKRPDGSYLFSVCFPYAD